MGTNTWVFGPSWWALLMCIGNACDELHRAGRMRPALADKAAHTLNLVAWVIPCIHCERSFKVFLERLRAEERARLPDLMGSGRAVRAVWRLHAMVDEKLHRQRVEAALASMRGGQPPRDVVESMERAGLFEARVPSLEVVRRRIATGTVGRLNEAHVFTVLFSLALNHPSTAAEEVDDPAAPIDPGFPGRSSLLATFLESLADTLRSVVAPGLGDGPRLASVTSAIRAVHKHVVRASGRARGGVRHAPRDGVVAAVAREHARVLDDDEDPKAIAARFAAALSVRSCSAATCE